MAFSERERDSVGTYEDLHASASRITGLTDFGPPIYEEGLRILLDDYAYDGYRESKLGMDAFARSRGVSIASLPTGQGIILKPPR